MMQVGLIFIAFVPLIVGIIVAIILGSEWSILPVLIGFLISFGILLMMECVPFWHKLHEELEELQLKKTGRKYFRAKEIYRNCSDAETAIFSHLNQLRMNRRAIPEAEHTGLVGVWEKTILESTFSAFRSPLLLFRIYLFRNYLNLNYILYSVKKLDHAEWERIKLDAELLVKQIYITLKQEPPCTITTAYAICILCESISPEISEEVTRVQTISHPDIRVCAAVIPENRWYLAAERTPKNSISQYSRKLLGQATFGKSFLAFPYRGNREYTEAFWDAVQKSSFHHD